jgi:hypothetical protein
LLGAGAHACEDTQEAEIRRISVQSQPRWIVREPLSQKYPSQKRAGGVAQGGGPEFKPQCCKNKSRFPSPLRKIEPMHLLLCTWQSL